MISITSQPLYPRGKSSLFPLHRRLGGSQSLSEHYGEGKNFLLLPGIKPTFLSFSGPKSSHYFDYADIFINLVMRMDMCVECTGCCLVKVCLSVRISGLQTKNETWQFLNSGQEI